MLCETGGLHGPSWIEDGKFGVFDMRLTYTDMGESMLQVRDVGLKISSYTGGICVYFCVVMFLRWLWIVH